MVEKVKVGGVGKKNIKAIIVMEVVGMVNASEQQSTQLKCKDCRCILDEPSDLPIAKREPCPDCGSVDRKFEIAFMDKGGIGI
jgi:hypothetical protein